MSRLRRPLEGMFRRVTTPTSVARMWHHIDARMRIGVANQRARRRRVRVRTAWLAAAAVVFTILMAGAAIRLRAGQSARPSAAPPATLGAAHKPRSTVAADTPPSGKSGESDDSVNELAPSVAVTASPSALLPAEGPLPRPSSWKTSAKRGQHVRAYRELGPGGVAQAAARASVEDLLVLADVARLSGHASEALEPLERVIIDHARDARAPLAAFMLGRVQLDALDAPATAARTFERAIAMGLPGGLAEDALAAVVEARARAGDAAGARAAHELYLATYPNGTRAADVKRWAAER